MSEARPEPFPWDQALRLCLGRLGMAPAAFWAMTPRELAAVLSPGGRPPRDGMTAERLAVLAAAFPD